jgi:hypothetical protein
MKQNIKNLRKIMKYSDGEPLEILVALIRIFIFPFIAVLDGFTPWWLILFAFSIGIYQLWAVSTRDIDTRNKANFASFVVSVLICLIILCKTQIDYRFIVSTVVLLICFVNLLKTNYQITKGSHHHCGHK